MKTGGKKKSNILPETYKNKNKNKRKQQSKQPQGLLRNKVNPLTVLGACRIYTRVAAACPTENMIHSI